MGLTVGVDLGGTFVKVALQDDDHTVAMGRAALSSVPKPYTPAAVADLIVSLAGSLLLRESLTWQDCHGIGLAAPGQVKDGVLVTPVNLEGWSNVPFRKLVQDALPCPKPIALVNDAEAAGIAECMLGWGRCKDRPTFILITLGTGVGGSVVVEGHTWRGSRGLIEIGHMVMGPIGEGPQCLCGQRGCLEVVSSATGVIAGYNSKRKADSKAVTSAEEVFKLAAEGDEVAKDVISLCCCMLATACLNLSRVFDPEAILFSGGMACSLLEQVKSLYDSAGWSILPHECFIGLASAAEDPALVGAIGAACGVMQLLKEKK